MMNGAFDISPDQIASVRAFNRFYTRQLGLLNEHLLKSPFSLTEARVMYELANREGLTATDLGRELGLDAGYVSRMLKKFERRSLVSRHASKADARQSILALTEAGRDAFAHLNRTAIDEVAAMLAPLPAGERARLLSGMRDIHRALGQERQTDEPYVLRAPEAGDFGWIIRRQAILYQQEYGWDETYEGLVAEIVGAFVKNFDPARERSWVAERNGEVVGSIFCVKASDELAKLRLLYVEPSARGLGIGQRLVKEVVRFSRAKRYRTLTLWTNDILVSARRIYQAEGFVLENEEPHHSFGQDLIGQTWTLAL
jgi:DNA-binding MarR family transcriptional regulator/N-acetylglutamate synthase-like GNAT family acetyltransferase